MFSYGRWGLSAFVAVFFSSFVYAPIANAQFSIQDGPSVEEVSATLGTINCFDYYHFGSVQVDVGPASYENKPGQTLAFTGKIKNSNTYPVVNGQVYVKIFKRSQPTEMSVRLNGYPIVGFFLAKDDISVPANGEQEVKFEWPIPSVVQGGEYEAAFYFTSAQRFNLLGLTFTDDVTGNKARFSVTAPEGSAQPVTFNKNTVTLNDVPYNFTTFLQHVEKDAAVTIHAELRNPNKTERAVTVTWTTSKWDGILEANVAKKETTSITLKPNETRKITYTPPVLGTSITFLQAELADKDAKSILNVRFVRDGFEDVRINFPAITSYPLKAGKENTLFSCVHATNVAVANDNTLVLTLKDTDGTVIHTYTYQGGITGSMMGVKDAFVPAKDSSTFSLTASLSHKGTIVDEVTQTYDCAQINPQVCPVPTRIPSYIYLGASLLVLLGGLLFIWKRRRSESMPAIPPSI